MDGYRPVGFKRPASESDRPAVQGPPQRATQTGTATRIPAAAGSSCQETYPSRRALSRKSELYGAGIVWRTVADQPDPQTSVTLAANSEAIASQPPFHNRVGSVTLC